MTEQPLKNLEMFKGNDWEQRLQVKADSDSQSIMNISTYGIIFTINDVYDEDPLSAIIQKKNVTAGGTGTQINMSSATNGIYKLIIDDTDTSGINSDTYKYDIKFTIGGKEYTQRVGTFKIKQVVNKD